MELLLIPIAILGFLLWDQRRRYDEQIQLLLDRITAPETVAAQRSPEPSSEQLFVPPDDDAAFREYLEQNGRA